MSSQSSRRLLCLAAALFVGGCLSPTLPLPPPNEPVVTGPNEQGLLTLSGNVPEGAWVTAWNRATERGWIQAAPTGRYDLEIEAVAGDPIALWYRVDGRQSETLEFTLPEPQP